jgi:hypothetical protein
MYNILLNYISTPTALFIQFLFVNLAIDLYIKEKGFTDV